MAYQVYDYEGNPYLIWNNDDLPIEYTLIPPRSGMNYPVYFDVNTQEWYEIGGEEEKPSPEPIPIPEPIQDNLEESIAQLMFDNMLTKVKLDETREELADLITKVGPLLPEESESNPDE